MDIFLLDPETPKELWKKADGIMPALNEFEFAAKRLKNGKPYTFFAFPQPHIVALYPKDPDAEKIRVLASQILALLKDEKCYKAEVVDVSWNRAEFVTAFMEGLYLSAYRFEDFKSEKTPEFKFSLKSLTVKEKELKEVELLCAEVNRSRRLIDLPFTGLNAKQLAAAAKQEAAKLNIKVKVWTDTELDKSGMGGLLGVNRGSVDKPSFTEMEYKPAKPRNKKPVVVVGKGIVFDAGGMNIKTGSYMDEMKTDMAGAAVAMGVVRAAAALKLPVWVKAVLPATDNRLNGNALVSGDVIKMYDGTTVEVVNTDAEGRLILADAVGYAAKKLNPGLIFTVATLTGAASRALGKEGAAAMQRNADNHVEALMQSGERTHERLCFFPMWKEYEEDLKSPVADLKNCGSGSAGMITAALFIERFADKHPFIHLDVAGVEYLAKKDAYRGAGATAFGVRLLIDFLKNYND